MTAFEEMGVLPEIAQAVEGMDWNLPTDIQADGIPAILGGGDVLMAAETGSGKTGAFSLPIVQLVFEWLRDVAEGKRNRGSRNVEVSSRWEINAFDRDDEIDIQDGVSCASQIDGWRGARANRAVHTRGKFYYEVLVVQGLCRIGWSSFQSTLDLGTDGNGFGFGGTGKKSTSRQFSDYGDKFGPQDVIGCFIDLDSGSIKFSKNGRDLGHAFNIRQFDKPLAPAFCVKNGHMVFNFGDTPFRFPPTSDWTAICRAPESSVLVFKPAAAASGNETLRQKNAPQALILEPSRELAEQTAQEIRKFKKHLPFPGLTEVVLVGGMSVREQMDALEQGVNIVVGTVGRVDDLVKGGSLALGGMRFFVLDECDALLSQGNGEMIARLHSCMPKIATDGKRVQTIICSATLHNFEVKKLAERIMYFPVWIDLKGEDTVPVTVHHCVVRVDPKTDTRWRDGNKLLPVTNRARTDNVHANDRLSPADVDHSPETASEAIKILKCEYVLAAIREHKMDRALIFCRTKLDCDNLEEYFTRLGGGPRAGPDAELSCVCMHSDISPADRKRNLDTFKEQRVRFLICTDVAARGIDIKGLPYVINMTLPDDKAQYLHRIGRVGRAERMGLAISLVASQKEKVWYHSCPSRGKQCANTRLADQGGCTIWYNEQRLLAEIEDSLNITVPIIGTDMRVPISELDGKVVYGERLKQPAGSNYQDHFTELGPARQELLQLEKKVQLNLLDLKTKRSYTDRLRDGMNFC